MAPCVLHLLTSC